MVRPNKLDVILRNCINMYQNDPEKKRTLLVFEYERGSKTVNNFRHFLNSPYDEFRIRNLTLAVRKNRWARINCSFRFPSLSKTLPFKRSTSEAMRRFRATLYLTSLSYRFSILFEVFFVEMIHRTLFYQALSSPTSNSLMNAPAAYTMDLLFYCTARTIRSCVSKYFTNWHSQSKSSFYCSPTVLCSISNSKCNRRSGELARLLVMVILAIFSRTTVTNTRMGTPLVLEPAVQRFLVGKPGGKAAKENNIGTVRFGLVVSTVGLTVSATTMPTMVPTIAATIVISVDTFLYGTTSISRISTRSICCTICFGMKHCGIIAITYGHHRRTCTMLWTACVASFSLNWKFCMLLKILLPIPWDLRHQYYHRLLLVLLLRKYQIATRIGSIDKRSRINETHKRVDRAT